MRASPTQLIPATPPSSPTLSASDTLSRTVSPVDELPPASSLPVISVDVDDPASGAALNSPLFASLQHVATDPIALNPDTVGSIPLQNNPRPMRALMSDSADYWVNGSGDLVSFKFPAQVDRNGQYGRIGPYFNLPPTGVRFNFIS